MRARFKRAGLTGAMKRIPALLAAVLAVALWMTPGEAQELGAVQPIVLTLDQERLFQGSAAAARISAAIERQAAELAAENREIEAALSAEELELTEARPTLEPEAFRALADAFDEKVQRIRGEQDAKERALQELREAERQNFLRRISPVLAEIARERGALLILDRRAVLLSADSIDITDEAIARIDASLTVDPPLGAPETSPEPAPDPSPETAPDTAIDGNAETTPSPEPEPSPTPSE